MEVGDVSIPFKRESTAKEKILHQHSGKRVSVSIPFKRESTAKAGGTGGKGDTGVGQFQFPSNGKAQRKFISKSLSDTYASSVSIPFKRESTAKVEPTLQIDAAWDMFQFPSNGKAQRKPMMQCQRHPFGSEVSIPFKRESTAKVKF